MKITLDANPSDAPCCIKLLSSDGRELLIQTDWDFPGIASTFGWSLRDVQPEILTAYFERFYLELPSEAVSDCSHPGACYKDVSHWAREIERPAEITPEKLALELEEYGAWDESELSDDSANWERLIWIAAGNLKEDKCKHSGTDGTVNCPDCGLSAHAFITAAREWLDENDGAEAEDPGYFEVNA